jgi:hypothetical protein
LTLQISAWKSVQQQAAAAVGPRSNGLSSDSDLSESASHNQLLSSAVTPLGRNGRSDAAAKRRKSAENHVFLLTILRREKFTFKCGYQ